MTQQNTLSFAPAVLSPRFERLAGSDGSAPISI
jgi:hypothetical protein